MTIGRIFSEVGDYASTVLDREHLSMSRKCMTRLNKVVNELIARQSIQSVDNLYDIRSDAPANADLASLTIAELYSLYRCWPLRHKERETAGRESFSFFYEGHIVRELKKRKATNKAEQFKIDYCLTTYHNELDNMSIVFSRPILVDDEKIYPNSDRQYSPEELTALLSLYKGYRDITEREILVEFVDYALDLLECENDTPCNLGLLTEIAELGRRKTIRVPEWVNRDLKYRISISGNDSALPLAMLTLQMINKDLSLEGKAQRIINYCYKSAFDENADLGKRIENLHTAVTCCDYVTRFSTRKAASLWNTLSDTALSTGVQLFQRQIFLLLEIAKECENYASISTESKEKLTQRLDDKAQTGCLEAMAFSKIVKLRF